jgi:hypothetical protein
LSGTRAWIAERDFVAGGGDILVPGDTYTATRAIRSTDQDRA